MDTDFQRFMTRVAKNGPIPYKSSLGNCWLWSGSKDVDNTHHSVSERREAAARNECVNGHPYTTENTYINRSGGRVRRRCQAIAQAKYRRKVASAAQPTGATR